MTDLEFTSQRTQEVLEELETAVAYGKGKLDAAKTPRPFLIVMCGAFSTGKTSLINALLGCDLPTGVTPITKTVTRLRYGDRKRFLVQQTDGGGEWEVTVEVAQEIVLNRKKDPRYRQVRIVIELPSPFLEKGVMVVDTPGFHDDIKEELDDVSKREIRNADFCIVNFSSNRFGTRDEREFLEELQDMTNGNFITVMNCMNYLMQAGQVEDLQDRAKHILAEFGNERLGKGRYFMVDSADRNDAELDGLDRWLTDLVERKGRAIQADTPLSMALTEMRKATAQADAYIQALQARIAALRGQNESSILERRRERRMERRMSLGNLREQLRARQDTLEMRLREASAQFGGITTISDFSQRAWVKVKSAAADQGNETDRWLRRNGWPEGMRTRFDGVLGRFSIPEPESHIRERGFFDPDRYLVGRYYYVYNDYVGEAQKAVMNVLLPKLKKQMERYLAEVEEQPEGRDGGVLYGGYEEDLEALQEDAERLSDRSLEALQVQREVRMLREKLLRRF